MPKIASHGKKAKAHMKAKTKQSKPQSKNLVAYGLIFALFIGTFLVVLQSQKQQQTLSHAAGDCTVSAADMQDTQAAKDFLTSINKYRASKGAAPLTMSPVLKKPAQWRSKDIATKQPNADPNHIDSTGRSFENRLKDCGVLASNIEENDAEGVTSAADALSTWQGDAGHDQNMFNPQMKYIGIGITNDDWVTDFSADAPNGTGTTSSASSSSSSSVASAANAVPSPNCLGGCPVSPSPGASVSAAPTASIAPVTVPAGTDNNTSLIGIILQLFVALFQAMFGR